MRKIITLLFLFIIQINFAQEVFQFTNGKKTVSISGKDISFFQNNEAIDSLNLLDNKFPKSVSTTYTGTFKKLLDNKVVMQPVSSIVNLEYENGTKKYIQTCYSVKSGSLISININELEKVQVPRKVKVINTIRILSCLGAFVVAPLASLNYSNGSFNTKTYAQISGFSLLAGGLTFVYYKDRNKLDYKTYDLKTSKRNWGFKIK